MWDKALLFIFIAILTYVLKSYNNLYNKIMFKLHFTYFYIFCSTVPLICPYPVINGKSVKNAKSWSRILKYSTVLYGVKWELRNGEVLAKDRGAVIVANHQSLLDVIGLFNIWETVDKLVAIAKKELFYAWPMGLAAYFGGTVFLDRKDPKDAYKRLLLSTDLMIKEKTKIWVFPEGTRNYDHTKFLPFKRGAFTMAVAAQTPILPVIFSPYYFIDRKNYTWSKGMSLIRFGSKHNLRRMIIQCLGEVSTMGLTMDDVPELMERVRSMMLVVYKELSKEVMSDQPKNAD